MSLLLQRTRLKKIQEKKRIQREKAERDKKLKGIKLGAKKNPGSIHCSLVKEGLAHV